MFSGVVSGASAGLKTTPPQKNLDTKTVIDDQEIAHLQLGCLATSSKDHPGTRASSLTDSDDRKS
jgi:hypothetical protein